MLAVHPTVEKMRGVIKKENKSVCCTQANKLTVPVRWLVQKKPIDRIHERQSNPCEGDPQPHPMVNERKALAAGPLQ
jgi:hypothetical protein